MLPDTGGDYLDSVRDELRRAANDALQGIKQDGQEFVDRVREELAGAVTDVASTVVNKAAGAIAPKADTTRAVPLNRTRVAWIVGGLVLLLLLVYFLARRR